MNFNIDFDIKDIIIEPEDVGLQFIALTNCNLQHDFNTR